MDLAFLFISALAASTILPMSSEIVLSALALAGATDVWLLLTVATAGNTLGAVVNWGIGPDAAPWPLPLRDVHLVRRRTTSELLRVIIGPEGHEEEARLFLEHVVVKCRDPDIVLAGRVAKLVKNG